jgi:hypothetical protein
VRLYIYINILIKRRIKKNNIKKIKLYIIIMNSENTTDLKKLILEYSTNVKNYAKWFEIADVNKNEDSYTTYKVIYRV